MATTTSLTQQTRLLKTLQQQMSASDSVVFYDTYGNAGLFHIKTLDPSKIEQQIMGLEGRLLASVDRDMNVFKGPTLLSGPISPTLSNIEHASDHSVELQSNYVLAPLSLREYRQHHGEQWALLDTLNTLTHSPPAQQAYQQTFSVEKKEIMAHMRQTMGELAPMREDPFAAKHAKGLMGLGAHLHQQKQGKGPSDDLLFALAKKATINELTFDEFVDLIANAATFKCTSITVADDLLTARNTLAQYSPQTQQPSMITPRQPPVSHEQSPTQHESRPKRF